MLSKPWRESALHCAILGGHRSTVQLLLDAGEEPSAPEIGGG